METKIFQFDVNQVDVNQTSKKSDAEQGLVSGYASVFGVEDSHSDIITAGAFAKSLSMGRQCKLLWQHEPNLPVGVINEIFEDDYGLYVKAKILLDVEKGRETYSLLKNGAMSGLSIGFTPVKSHYEQGTNRRIITEIDLWEISFVTFPSNPMANVTMVKCDGGNEKLLIKNLDRALQVLS